jgi:DNA recombination protein RmuC
MTEALETRLETNRTTIETKLNELKADSITTSGQLRGEIQQILVTMGDGLRDRAKETADAQRVALESMVQKVEQLSETNAQALEKLRISLQENLTTLRNENTEKLEQMRHTVDEKLQGTLEKRLGDSFKLVSDRLEEVHSRGRWRSDWLSFGNGNSGEQIRGVG